METPLMCAAENKSAQAPAIVQLLLKAEADVNATDKVDAWEAEDVGCRVYAVAARWIVVVCSPVR